jgi:hypothetical protein
MKNSSKIAITAAISAFGAGVLVKRLWKQKFNEEHQINNRNEKMSQLYYHWLLLKLKNIKLDQFFVQKGYQNIAVMDLSPQGRRLIDELAGTDVTIRYAIERDNLAAIHETLEVLRLHDDPLPAVDAVVICSLHNYSSLSKEIAEELDSQCPIFAIETVIAETMELNGLHPRDGVLSPMLLKASD